MADQKKYTNKLLNACVLVIGGSSGIGYAVAEAALESGAIVTISSSNPQRVATKVQSLQSAYPSSSSKVHGVVADLSNPSTVESEIERMFKQAVEPLESKHFDHVIFTAADALSMMPLKDMSMEKILKAGQLRFFAPLLVAKYLPHYLTNSHKSSYTITTGGISESPVPDWSVIGSYAGGHHAMVRNLALDLRPIRVCGVSPGVVDTEMWVMAPEQKKAFLNMCAKRMATGAPGQAEDVAESFLAVMRDTNMDASVIRTDGGSMVMGSV